MAERADLPVWWVLGTFHAAVLMVALVWLVYPGGSLGSILSGLSTLSGIGLFVALWLISLFTTRRALRGLDWLTDEPNVMSAFFWRAMRWGAATGMLFLGVLILVVAVNAATSGAQGGQSTVVFVLLVYGTIGTVFAAVIGGIVGVALGALDIAALRIARALAWGSPRAEGD